MSTASDNEALVKLGATGYLYGFPLVFNLAQVARYVSTGVGANPAAPFNSFSHARQLAGPADQFVSINNDTVYSMAQIDLSVGPVLLDVPATGERYYVLQFVSAWTDNFAYVGTRATGGEGGRYLLVPPGWQGDVPGDARVITFPTRVGSIVGRWAVASPDDLGAVHALQDACTLTPLSSEAAPVGLPLVGEDVVGEELRFWETYRLYSQAFAPAARDLELQQSLAALGLTGDVPVNELPAQTQALLVQGFAAGRNALNEALRSGSSLEVRNGWQLSYHVFDYNLDHFEVGAVDAEQWKIADPMTRLVVRAGAALGGLWGNHAYEAAYSPVYVDANGEQLSGENHYTLRLDPPPPNDGFWSLTMYDVPNYYLVANPIDRYSIGDRTPGLVWDADGALTLHLSHAEPSDPAARANWLPTPADAFRPLLRVYAPHESFTSGDYVVPAIQRVDESGA